MRKQSRPWAAAARRRRAPARPVQAGRFGAAGSGSGNKSRCNRERRRYAESSHPGDGEAGASAGGGPGLRTARMYDAKPPTHAAASSGRAAATLMNFVRSASKTGGSPRRGMPGAGRNESGAAGGGVSSRLPTVRPVAPGEERLAAPGESDSPRGARRPAPGGKAAPSRRRGSRGRRRARSSRAPCPRAGPAPPGPCPS